MKREEMKKEKAIDNMDYKTAKDEMQKDNGMPKVVRMADAKGLFDMLPEELQGIAIKVQPGESIEQAIKKRLEEYNKNKK